MRFPVFRFAVALVAVGLPAQEIPNVLTLDDAVRIGMRQRGEVDASRALVRAREGRRLQASLAPNPLLYIQMENLRFHGTPRFSISQDIEAFAFVSQTIETAGKRRRRTEAAEAERDVATQEAALVEWAIRQAIKQAYWVAFAAQERETLIDGTLRTASELAAYQQTRWREGAAAEVDYLKAAVELERMRAASATASIDSEQAMLALWREMAAETAPSGVRLAAQDAEAVPARPALVEHALRARPELQFQRAVVESARSSVELEKAYGKPDITPYAGYKRIEGFDTLVGGVTIPLPMRDRNQGAIAESHAEVHRQQALLRAAEARVRNEVEAALAAFERRLWLLQSLDAGPVNRAGETYEIALAAYQEQGTDLLYVLDAQRIRTEVLLLRNESLRDLRLSLVNLETAVGAALGGVVEQPADLGGVNQ